MKTVILYVYDNITKMYLYDKKKQKLFNFFCITITQCKLLSLCVPTIAGGLGSKNYFCPNKLTEYYKL